MTSTDLRARHPRGIPVGGQFAAAVHAEPRVSLDEGPECIPDLIDLTPEARSVLGACRAAGGRPLIVGGSVRDALLSRETGGMVAFKDIDIEVHGIGDPGRLKKQLARVGAVGEHGASFGVLGVRIGDQDFDVTLPRRDNKTGVGHRGFAVEVDPELGAEEAFGRRDFTINSMGWDDATGELVDPFGGRHDLEQRILRHTSNAFDQDPLRVLRSVQFAARFGMDLAPETAQLCRRMAPSFTELPREQVWGEFSKLAAKGTHISKALKALHDSGWEEHFPSLAAVRGVEQDPHWHPEGTVDVHLGLAGDAAAAIARRDGLDEPNRQVVVLAAMLHDLGKATHTEVRDGRITSHDHAEAGVEPARDFLTRIGAPAHVKDKVLPLVAEHMSHAGNQGEPTPTAVRRLQRRLDSGGRGPSIEDWARVVDADLTGRGSGNKQPIGQTWVQVARQIGDGTTRPSKALLRGQHLMAAGMKPGPEFAKIIKASLEAQDEGLFADEEGVKAWLERWLSASGR